MATIGQLQLAYPTGVTVAFEKPCSAVENGELYIYQLCQGCRRLSTASALSFRTGLGEQFYCGKYVHCGLTLGPE